MTDDGGEDVHDDDGGAEGKTGERESVSKYIRLGNERSVR